MAAGMMQQKRQPIPFEGSHPPYSCLNFAYIVLAPLKSIKCTQTLDLGSSKMKQLITSGELHPRPPALEITRKTTYYIGVCCVV